MVGALGELRSAAPEAFAGAGAIGFSGQMHGAVLIGRDGKPLRPAILHNDGRAHREAAELWERHRPLADVVGVKPMAGFVAPKLIWLARHEPSIFAAIAHVIQPKDYLRFRLTGEIASDMSDAAGTWWLDERARAWSIDALAASGVDPACAPPTGRGQRRGRVAHAGSRRRARPAAATCGCGGRRRRRGRRGRDRRDAAGRRVHLARHRFADDRRFRRLSRRAGKARPQLRPCAAAPLVSDGGDAQRRRRARLRRPPRRRRRRRARARSGGELSRPRRDDVPALSLRRTDAARRPARARRRLRP